MRPPPWHKSCEFSGVHLPALCRSHGLRIHSSIMRPRFPRPTILALAAMLLAAPALVLAAEVKLVRVWPEYRAAASFTRIAEYFGGKEKASELIVRTRPESRDGYYFLTRFKSSEALRSSISCPVKTRPACSFSPSTCRVAPAPSSPA